MRRRDEAEFEDFARARSPDLMRAALALTGDHASAEDLVQTTLVKAYTHWRRIQAAGNPVAYVRTMQLRLFLDRRRRRSSGEILVADPPESTAPADDIAQRETLLTALRELTPLDRAVVVHRYLFDTDVATVAANLRLTPQAVRSRSARALAAMRNALHVEADGGAQERKGSR